MGAGHGAGLDVARLLQLANLLGAERLSELIDILAERLDLIRVRLQEGSAASDLIAAVHQSCGSASSLGLPRLAGLLGELETLIGAAASAMAINEPAHNALIAKIISKAIAELKDSGQDARHLLGFPGAAS